MFKQESNAACNNALFSSHKIDVMNDQMTRLYAAAAELAGITGQSEIARRLNVSPQVVKNWESRGISKSGLLTAQRELGCRAEWLQHGTGSMRPTNQTSVGVEHFVQVEHAGRLIPTSSVPVVGYVQGGDDGYLVELEYPVGHGDGYLMHHSKDQNAYGLRVRGDSMRPRIKPGEYIVCEPSQEALPGDDVVVLLRDKRRMVKELLWHRDGEYCFGSINAAHGQITVPESAIEAIHYVAAIMPRGAPIRTKLHDILNSYNTGW